MPGGTLRRPAELLLVEDDPGEVRLFREALRDMPVPVQLTPLPDGETALALLRSREPSTLAPRPDLVFVSLKLPKLDGHAVIQAIRNAPQ